MTFEELKTQLRTTEEVSSAMNFALDLIRKRDSSSVLDHWAKISQFLIAATSLHLLYLDPDRNVESIHSYLSDTKNTMIAILNEMKDSNHDTEETFYNIYGKKMTMHPFVHDIARDLLYRPQEELAGVWITAVSYLRK